MAGSAILMTSHPSQYIGTLRLNGHMTIGVKDCCISSKWGFFDEDAKVKLLGATLHVVACQAHVQYVCGMLQLSARQRFQAAAM